ncbi:MAG: ABC transporter permease [Ruminococcaceae bacterium]|nr:ABC transporter permease [Oscillospiraceae bacterium]
MLVQFIFRAVLISIPLLYGATGEIITEKSGHLNLGIPGIMYVGAISGVSGAFIYENMCGNDPAKMNAVLAILIPLLCTIIGSALVGLLYSFLTVTMRANQNVTGLAITTFGIGIGNFLGGSLIKLVDSDIPSIALTSTSKYFKATLPFADKLGWFGDIFLSYDFLTYFAIIAAVVATIVLDKTRVGLNLRSVGENPATADAAGVNVAKYRYGATIIGAVVAGLGGIQYVMAYADGVWSNNAFGDRGWMAIAIVIFALWKPSMAILCSFLFGALCNLNNYINGLGTETQELFKMLPYVVTIIVLVFTSIRKKREHQPPESLGLNYFREER